MAHIGIDIGTSYSSVCILNENGQPERVKIATGTSVFGDSYSLPSAVFLEEDGRLLLGQAAIASRMRAPQNFKNEFKRDLGQQAPYLIGGNSYLPEDLYKEFFIYIKKCVEDYTHKNVDGATVTFPAMFNENKKKLIESAAKRAGLLEINLLDEPSAAAYSYLNTGKISEGNTLLVYDLGGGTFDLALIRLHDGKFEPLAQPMGNPRLGGADFDRIIFDDIMAQIGEERVGPIKSNPVNYSRFVTMVFELAIKAKHHLSSSSVFSDIISVGYDAVEYTLERSRYNAMIAPLIDDTMNRVREILLAANLKQSDVNKVLLVGGASRTPLVREMLFRERGQEPHKDVDPELAVCEGAVVMSVCMRKTTENGKRRLEEDRRRQEELEEERQAKEARQIEVKKEQERRSQLKSKANNRQTISTKGHHNVGVRPDGTVVAVGENDKGQCNVSSWRDIVSVSSEFYHTVGLRADGTVVAVGMNGRMCDSKGLAGALLGRQEYVHSGQCDVDGWRDIVSIGAGHYHTVGLKADGTVVAAGENEYGQCNVSSWKDIVLVSACFLYTVGLKADGTVVAVGLNDMGQCNVNGWRDIVSVSAGYKHAVGLRSDGTVVAVGRNDNGQCDVSGWRDIISVSAGGLDHTVGLRSDGTVVAVGDNDHGLCDVNGWRDIVAVSSGSWHTIGLKSDGTVVAVGSNYDGECNVSGWRNIRMPQ